MCNMIILRMVDISQRESRFKKVGQALPIK